MFHPESSVAALDALGETVRIGSTPARTVMALAGTAPSSSSPAQPRVRHCGDGRRAGSCESRMAYGCDGVRQFHLHLFEDVIGARGPDGYQWPIPYLSPFSHAADITWSHQWALNAWPNFAITVALVVVALCLAWSRGFSPLEMISRRADRAFVQTLRARFPESRPASSRS